MADPRVFFAAERTLLAWIRTGITIIGLGFVVARFGLFLTMLAFSRGVVEHAGTQWAAAAIGITLVVLGTVSIALAMYRHTAYTLSLPPEDVPDVRSSWLAASLAAALVIAGMLLAIYLLLT